MKNVSPPLLGLFLVAAVAAAFSAWSASGNEVALCVTAGCTLFHDTAVAGISLWWLGAAAFAALALLALAGAAHMGRRLAGLALLGDCGLLLLMAATAPCVSCLVAAAFFATLYKGFRHAALTAPKLGETVRPSILLLLWGLLFVVNVGAALRTQAAVWPLTDNMDEATVRVFFSPSCPTCREAVTRLSGHVDVAFYPVAESEADLAKIAQMAQLLHEGASMRDALARAQDAAPSGLSAFSPDSLLLRLRLLRNKAHVFLAGSPAVPFFEYHGMPAFLREDRKPDANRAAPRQPASADLPIDPQTAGQCVSGAPCP